MNKGLTLALGLLAVASCEQARHDVDVTPVQDEMPAEDLDGVPIDGDDGQSNTDAPDINFIPVSCDGKPIWDIFEKDEARTGPVRMGCGAVWGRMRPALVHDFLRADETVAAVNGCGAGASITHRVSVRFVVGRDGRVGHVAATRDSPVGTCIEEIVRKARFPPPNGGPVHVTIPIEVGPSL